jgi:hypothetical protein
MQYTVIIGCKHALRIALETQNSVDALAMHTKAAECPAKSPPRSSPIHRPGYLRKHSLFKYPRPATIPSTQPLPPSISTTLPIKRPLRPLTKLRLVVQVLRNIHSRNNMLPAQLLALPTRQQPGYLQYILNLPAI